MKQRIHSIVLYIETSESAAFQKRPQTHTPSKGFRSEFI